MELHPFGLSNGVACREIRSPAANVTVVALLQEVLTLPSTLQVMPVLDPFLRTVKVQLFGVVPGAAPSFTRKSATVPDTGTIICTLPSLVEGEPRSGAR